MSTPIPLPPKPGEVVPMTEPVTAPTPHELLSRAVLAGAPFDVVERLSKLCERWDDRQIRKAFENAMAAARAEGVPIITKSRTVDFTTAKGRTRYDYEEFADVMRVADSVFPRHGIAYRFRPTQDGNKVTVTCILSHRDGYWEEHSLSAIADESGNKNTIQAVGSTVTYLQRYTLKSALGLAASVDDDGRGAGGLKETVSPEQALEIHNLIEETGSNHELFCKFMRVSDVESIPADRFAFAKAQLERKRRQHGTENRGVEDGASGQTDGQPLP